MGTMPSTQIELGRWPQTKEGEAAPIVWRTLGSEGEYQLLISRYALITTGYCDPKLVQKDLQYLTWQHSLARQMCQQLYEQAFTAEEKTHLKERTVLDGEERSQDHVFLLSEEELDRLLPEPAQRKAVPTPYALRQGARRGWTDETRENCGWWLLPENQPMTLGHIYAASGKEFHREIYPKAVFENGEAGYHGRNAFHSDFTIRPCILYAV